MKTTPKSNKERGPVRMNEEASPGTTKTANPHRANPNQKRGPTTGNAGTVSKQRSFLEEKSHRNSYFGALADMVQGALQRRGNGMKPNQPVTDDPQALKSLKGDWGRARRGPTTGNK